MERVTHDLKGEQRKKEQDCRGQNKKVKSLVNVTNQTELVRNCMT